MIDLNAAIGRWPFAAREPESPSQLTALLQRMGVQSAYVSPVEAILAPDPMPDIFRLCDEIDGSNVLQPAGVIDPTLTNAMAQMRRLVQNHPVKLVKLYPGFHGLAADDDRNVECVAAVAEEGILTAVLIRVEDDRNQPRLLRAGSVPIDELVCLARKVAPVPVLALNATRHELMEMLDRADNLFADIAFVESWSSVPNLLEKIEAERLVFGSNTPFFYPQAAGAKLANPELTEDQRRMIGRSNAEALLTAIASGRDRPRRD